MELGILIKVLFTLIFTTRQIETYTVKIPLVQSPVRLLIFY